MAADENFRLSDVALPGAPMEEGRILGYLRELLQAIVQRDVEVKNKVNQLHVEYVETEPSDAPDEPEPVFRIYQTGGNYYLYIYINSLWKRVTLV